MKLKHPPLHKNNQRIVPPHEAVVNFNSKKPKLSFEFLAGDYCITKCELREKAEIVDTLYRLSQHSWQELLTLGRKHGGCEPLSLSELNCPIPNDLLFQGQKHATVFHNVQRIPVIGFRIEETLYIFGIDRDYTAYNHGE